MAHTTREKKKLLNRVRRIRGQVEGIERALEDERDCTDVLHMIAGCRGAINGLMVEVLEGHIGEHVLNPTGESTPEQREAAQELIDVIRSYMK